MSINPENNKYLPGHKHKEEDEEESAVIIQFPVSKQVEPLDDTNAIEQNKLSRGGLAAVGLVTLYASSAVGHSAYKAYETLEGKDELYANAIGGAAIGSGLLLSLVWVTDKFRR
jgi:hypothetical protein